MSDNTLGFLPVTRADGGWHLSVGAGRVRIRDEALVEDLDQLRALLAPDRPREEAVPE
ncbi:hypothetical protein ACIQWA_07375 [Kitasatospora sp. NPDC098652]|uniref:hypothetical protein n=1 Tax=Kitasatospora sp. NPDC098652 TaxID=3364095 RepID=UPI0038165704